MRALSRRFILGVLGAGLAAAPFAAFARSRSAGPLATRDRKQLFRNLARYLSLVDRGDEGQRAYLAGPSPAKAAAQLRKTTLLNVAVDDGGQMIAVEFRVESQNSAADSGVAFFRIANGYITEILPLKQGVQLVRGAAGNHSAPSRVFEEELPATVTSPRMTRAKFEDYLELFRRFDERFTYYYADDVVFAASPAPAPLHGREGVLGLYRPLRKNLGEELTVHHLVIDSQANLMIAALTNKLTAYGKVVLPSTVLEAGDQMILSGAIVYGLKDGRIGLIRDVGG